MKMTYRRLNILKLRLDVSQNYSQTTLRRSRLSDGRVLESTETWKGQELVLSSVYLP